MKSLFLTENLLFLTFSLSLSLPLSLSLSLTHTHTHTHTISLSHTYTQVMTSSGTLMKESRLLMVAASPLCAALSSFGPPPFSSSDACPRACVYTYACARAHALSEALCYLCMRPWPTSVSALKLLVYAALRY